MKIQVKNWLNAPVGEATVRKPIAKKKGLVMLGIAGLAVAVAIVAIALLSHLQEIGNAIGSWFPSETPKMEQTVPDIFSKVFWVGVILYLGRVLVRMLKAARGDEAIAVAVLAGVTGVLLGLIFSAL